MVTRPVLLILAGLLFSKADQQFCVDYVECEAVSLVEERLCLGNSLIRPYWLPQRKDPNGCHEKLKNDYLQLERLEEEKDDQFKACLLENFQPLDNSTSRSCQLIGPTPRFSFDRTISYVPSRCFAGLQKRVDRQCGQLRNCCRSLEKCRLLNSESNLIKMLKSVKNNLLKRAADCDKGLPVEHLQLQNFQFSHDSGDSKDRTGFVNVKFNSPQRDPGQNGGFVNVHFTTANNLIGYNENSIPKLSYPSGEKKVSLPRNGEEFDEAFDKAMANTNRVKEQLKKWDRQRTTNTAIGSLLDAASISEVKPPMGTVTVSESVDDNLSFDDFGDSSFSSSDAVTSSPIIFVEREAAKPRPTCSQSKTFKFTKVLQLLGEKSNSTDLEQIRGLVSEFEAKLDGKVLSGVEQKSLERISTSLENLIKDFHPEDFEKIHDETTSAIEKMKTDCRLSMTLEITPDNSTSWIDENGDTIVVKQDGFPTLVLSSSIDEKIEKEEEMRNFISDEYKKEVEEFRKRHHIWSQKNVTIRNETTCDMYMRCRNQMHLAVDTCAWQFASDKLLSTMAESAESLMFKDENICSPRDEEVYNQLFENLITRNTKVRDCLDKKNEVFFSQSVCLAYSEEERETYERAMSQLLKKRYSVSSQCFKDANLIQEKCSKLRDCCPNFDRCREETMDSQTEQTIISATAKINELKQNCVKEKAKKAVKEAVRQLLLSNGGRSLTSMGLDISRGARVVRMARLRENE